MLSRSAGWRRSALARRLLSGFGANALGKVWVLLVQFLLVPILSVNWGLEGYGTWLMLSTIPAYVAMADFGMTSAASVEMTRHISRGAADEAARVYYSIRLFMVVFLGCIVLLAVTGIAIWQFIDPSDNAIPLVVVCMVLSAAITVQTSVQRGVFTATQRYAKGTFLSDVSMPVEGMIVAIVALNGHGMLAAAACMICTRLLWLFGMSRFVQSFAPWSRTTSAKAEWKTIKRLMRPSLAVLAMTGANAVTLQGMILAIGFSAGPAAAAVFGTVRMLTRAPLQFSALLARASQPELTTSQEKNKTQLTKQLMQLNLIGALAVMLPCALVLAFFGPEILRHVSHGTMQAPQLWFLIMIGASVCTAIWTVLAVPLVAMNRQEFFAWRMLMIYTGQVLAVAVISGYSIFPYVASLTAEAVILFMIGRVMKVAR